MTSPVSSTAVRWKTFFVKSTPTHVTVSIGPLRCRPNTVILAFKAILNEAERTIHISP